MVSWNGNVTPTQGDTVLSATNGLFVSPTTASVWNVNVQNTNPNGSATSANSSPVVIASDDTVTVTPSSAAVWNVHCNSGCIGSVNATITNAVTVLGSVTPTQGSLPLSLTNGLYVSPTTASIWSVNCVTGCSSSTSITGWAGGTLGAMANYGTSPGAVLVPGVNAYVTNTVTSTGTLAVTNLQAGAALSATNGLYVLPTTSATWTVTGTLANNNLQGGAALSLTNGLFVSPTTASVWPASGIYLSATPNLSSGQQALLQLTSAGSLHTTVDNTVTATGTLAVTNLQAGSALSSSNGLFVTPTTPSLWQTQQTSQYPVGSTVLMGSVTGTSAATLLTLTPGAGRTMYLCGFSIRANATAAATGNATVTGTTSQLNFTQWTAPLASGVGVTEMIFQPCVPGSAANQAIGIAAPAPGSGGVLSTSAWGYYL
jgi:hypothetical protein